MQKAGLSDQASCVAKQYEVADNLNARISLHDKFSTNKYGWQRWVFDQLLVPSLGTILELGCGFRLALDK